MYNSLDELTPNQAAHMVGETPDTLTAWRKTRRHIPFLQHPDGTVTYLRRDLTRWMERRKPEYIVPEDWEDAADGYYYPTATRPAPKYMNRSQLARYLGVSTATPATWARRNVGPPCESFANRYTYEKRDVDLWVKHSTEPEAERVRKRREELKAQANQHNVQRLAQ